MVKHNNGFTLIEILLVIAVLIILLTMSIVALLPFQKQSDLQSSSQEIINALRRAQNRTLASENDSTFGVFIDTISSPHRYTLFQGTTYASRDPSFDEISLLSESIEFFVVDLGGGDEIVFDRLEGTTSQPGDITIRLKSSPSQTKVVYIDALGVVETTSAAAPSDSAREKDSRHVHVDYKKIGGIDTATESVTLDFDSGVHLEVIPIVSNLNGGQFSWEGEVDVAGEIQNIKIHTLTLNSGGGLDETQFSIHRDLRLNSKELDIRLSGDGTGDIIQYDSSNNTIETSDYVFSPPVWQ